ncbi:MAG TPA: flagellar hook-associated protein FlgL [Solirubrobacteraceae bacterium]|jgi:flagellar hook-associated protein 3 FlgL|nr:flagellar hook-associated protein FlgL [Solirubrobacteraceae bacterium]
MSERITPAMVTGSTLNDINSALGSLERSSNELSSGRSILEPSDNPYGASRAIDLQSQLDGLTSYTNSAQDGISWESTATGAMSNMSNLAERARELLVQSSNGVYNQGDRNNIAAEIEQLAQTIKQDANTQYAGQYVFSGTATDTAPYLQGENDAYQGNAEAVTRVIGPNASVTVNTNISSLLGNGMASGDGKLLDVLGTIAQHLRGGTTEDLQALSSTDLKNLDGNIETLTQLQANAGSATDQLQMAVSRIEGLQVTITQTLSNTEDVDFAKASIDYSNEQAAYDAALRAGANIVQESLLNFLH